MPALDHTFDQEPAGKAKSEYAQGIHQSPSHAGAGAVIGVEGSHEHRAVIGPLDEFGDIQLNLALRGQIG